MRSETDTEGVPVRAHLVLFLIHALLAPSAHANWFRIRCVVNAVVDRAARAAGSDLPEPSHLHSISREEALRIRPWEAQPYQYQADVSRDGPRAFTVGGVNSDDTIRAMTGVTGLRWADIDARTLRTRGSWAENNPVFDPNDPNTSARSSVIGMRRDGQSSQELMLQDNQTVSGLGLSHQQIATPLFAAMREFERRRRDVLPMGESPVPVPFEYEGRHYLIEGRDMDTRGSIRNAGNPRGLSRLLLRNSAIHSRYYERRHFHARLSGWVDGSEMTQGSPFNDELFTNYTFTIRSVDTNELLAGDGLTPHMIYRYGFYQGGDFRMDPTTIARFFRLTPRTNAPIGQIRAPIDQVLGPIYPPAHP